MLLEKEISEIKIQVKKSVLLKKKNLYFIIQQKGKEGPSELATRIKILAPKQML